LHADPRFTRLEGDPCEDYIAELVEALACVRTIHAARHGAVADHWEALRALLMTMRDYCDVSAEPTVTPEQMLREAGIGSKRQAAYQRKMSTLLAGRGAVNHAEVAGATSRAPGRARRGGGVMARWTKVQ
jgi:hypothetical protein